MHIPLWLFINTPPLLFTNRIMHLINKAQFSDGHKISRNNTGNVQVAEEFWGRSNVLQKRHIHCGMMTSDKTHECKVFWTRQNNLNYIGMDAWREWQTKEQQSIGYNGLHRLHEHVDVFWNAGWTTSNKLWRDGGSTVQDTECAELFLDRQKWRQFFDDRS